MKCSDSYLVDLWATLCPRAAERLVSLSENLCANLERNLPLVHLLWEPFLEFPDLNIDGVLPEW